MSSFRPTARSPPDRRRAVGLLALLALGAIGIGTASVLLLPTSGPAAPGGGPGTFAGATPTFAAAGELVAVFAVGIILLFLYMRFAGPGAVIPKRFLSLILVYFLVAISFLALVHLVGPSVLTQSGPADTTGNGTGTPVNSTPPPNGTVLNSSTFSSPHYSLAFWYLIGGAIGVAVAGLLMALWYLGRPGAESRGSKPPQRSQVGDALERALRSLDGSGDPRAVLIALYGQLLARIGGSLPELESATPREIEQACVEDLGIPPGPSAELRHLFERARYSTLPMGADDVDRARSALKDALSALQPAARRPP